MDVLARNQEAVFLVSRKRGNTVIGRKAEAYAADEGTVAAIEAGVPALVEAREIIAEFHLMIRRKAKARRASAHGSSAARPSLVASFASGVAKDGVCGREVVDGRLNGTAGRPGCREVPSQRRSSFPHTHFVVWPTARRPADREGHRASSSPSQPPHWKLRRDNCCRCQSCSSQAV